MKSPDCLKNFFATKATLTFMILSVFTRGEEESILQSLQRSGTDILGYIGPYNIMEASSIEKGDGTFIKVTKV